MKSGFFDNTEVVSEDFARLVSGIVTSGVLNDSYGELQVTAGGGMKVSVSPGYCWIEGHFGKAEAAETLNIDTASGSVGRIDRIVARCDYEAHKVYLTVIKGEEGAEPTPPPILRDGTYYDLGLATVSVPAGTIEITDSLITDTRTDNAVCGGCLMRTGVVLDFAGKADKTALDEAYALIDKNAEDIAAQAARAMVTRSFEGTSTEAEASACSVGVAGDCSGAAVVKVTGSFTATRKYYDSLEKEYTDSYSTTFEIILFGEGDSESYSSSGNFIELSISASVAASGVGVTGRGSVKSTSDGTIIGTALTVSYVKGAFLT